jgi:hypothetical protein
MRIAPKFSNAGATVNGIESTVMPFAPKDLEDHYSHSTSGRVEGFPGDLSTSERAKDLMSARYSANQRKRYL